MINYMSTSYIIGFILDSIINIATIVWDFTLKNPVLITGTLTIIILFYTFHISRQNWKISKNTLRFNLYKQRYKIYLCALRLAATISVKQRISIESVTKFRRISDQSRFLFGPDIQNYMDEIYTKSLRFRTIIRILDPIEEKINLGYMISSDQFQEKSELTTEKFVLIDYFETQINNIY